MTKSLQSRKRQLVRDAIYDAAIELFAKKGFDETTVEEVADAAGISRRSFFRYFESKDDLLALNTVHTGEILIEAVESCPSGLSPIEVVREVVSAGIKFNESIPRIRQVIEIAIRSASALQAHQSRLMEVEAKLASAYSVRLKSGSREILKPRILAGLSLLVMNSAIGSWFSGEYKDMASASKQCFLTIARTLGDERAAASVEQSASGAKSPGSRPRKKSGISRK
jgi:AcrR family transcriptional regulator